MATDGSEKLMAILAAGHEAGWPAIRAAQAGEELRLLEEQRAAWKARLGASSAAQLQLLERNLAARLVQGLATDVPGAMEVFDELVRAYVDSALNVVDEDAKAAKALLSKADRMTSELSLAPSEQNRWVKLRALALSGQGHFARASNLSHAALQCFDAAGKTLEQSNDDTSEERAGCHLNICVMLSRLRKHKQALRHAHTALTTLLDGLNLGQHWEPVTGAASLQTLPLQQRSMASMLSIAYHNMAVQLEATGKKRRAAVAMRAASHLAQACSGFEDRPVTQMRKHIQENEQSLSRDLEAQPAKAGGVAEKFFTTHGSESAGWNIDEETSEIAVGNHETSEFNVTAPLNTTTSSLQRDSLFRKNPVLTPVRFGGHQRIHRERRRAGRGSQGRRARRANTQRSKSSFEIRQESSAELLSLSGSFSGTVDSALRVPSQRPLSLPQLEAPGSYAGSATHSRPDVAPASLPPFNAPVPSALPPMQSAPNAGLWNNAAGGLPAGVAPVAANSSDPEWRKISRISSSDLIALIFTTVSPNLRPFTMQDLKASPFGEALTSVWQEMDINNDKHISASEWRSHMDEVARLLGANFRKFLVDMIWAAGVDVTPLSGSGAHATVAPASAPTSASNDEVVTRLHRAQSLSGKGMQRHQAATRLQAVHRGNVGRKRFQARREAFEEESTELYTHGDFQLDYSARRSFLSAKQDASLSNSEIEAEARRVFAEFDSNTDRRIDKAELGQLLYALMVQRHGKEHVTMSPSAFSFAASLWLQSGDTNQDGTLDVDEFVKLYQRLQNSPVLLHGAAGKVAARESSAATRLQAVQRGKLERKRDPLSERAMENGRRAWRRFKQDAAAAANDPEARTSAAWIFDAHDATSEGKLLDPGQAGAVMAQISSEIYGVNISADAFQLAQSMISDSGSASSTPGALDFDEFYVRYATVLSSPLVAGAIFNAKPKPELEPALEPKPELRQLEPESEPEPEAELREPEPEPEPEPESHATPHAEAAVASFELGSALIGASDWAGARTAYLAALAMGHPEPNRCRNGAGIASALMEDQEEAIAQFTASLELAPTDPRTLHNRAQAYRALGRWKLAEADAKKACELDPDGDGGVSQRLAEETELEKAASQLQSLQRGRIARRLWYRTLMEMRLAKKAQQAKADRQKDAKLVAPIPPLLRVATHTPDKIEATEAQIFASEMVAEAIEVVSEEVAGQVQGNGDGSTRPKERKVVTIDTDAAVLREADNSGPPSAAFDTPAASKARQLTGELESVLERNAAKAESTEG